MKPKRTSAALDCIPNGEPPCPTCPVADTCPQGRRNLVLDTDKYYRKLRAQFGGSRT